MAIVVIQSSDLITNSRAVINANFSYLDGDKLKISNNLSDVASAPTAINNILPTQAALGGKVLGTDGSNVSWVDPSGATHASTVVEGVVFMSTAPSSSSHPIAVGDNDTRMPTQAMRDALAGTGTPAGTNKFVTADTDALKELLSNKDTTGTLGTSDTKYPSQKAVKTYVDTTIGSVAIVGNVAVGDWLLATDPAVVTGGGTGGSYARIRRFTVTRAGAYRVKVDYQASASSGADGVKIKIYINGVAASSASSDIFQPYSTFSYDTTTLAIGDVIEVWGESTALTTMTKNFNIYTDGSKLGGFIQS